MHFQFQLLRNYVQGSQEAMRTDGQTFGGQTKLNRGSARM